MKRLSAIILIALLIILGLTACTDKKADEVLPATTIHVATASDLAAVREYVGAKYANYTIELDNDIDLSGIDVWEPIGTDADNAFCGVFDGKGKTISGLKVAGLNSDGSPVFVAKDKGIENVSSFASYGLFGYVSNAAVKNVKLTNVNMNYYVDHTGYSYVGALAGINLGDSAFEDIEVSGKVVINNLYHKYKTYDNRGEEQNVADECTATLYFGGAVAYSNGNSTFKNIKSHVDFNNYNYCAYYRDRSTILSAYIDEDEEIEEKYVVSYHDTFINTKLRQVIAGGVIGQLKGGSLKEGVYDGDVDLNCVSSYAGGLVGAAYATEIIDGTVNAANLVSKVKYKNASGGIVALVDGTTVKNCAVNNVAINAEKLDADVMTMSEGGIFGYASNLAKITDSAVSGARINVDLTNAEVGGVGGVIKDSSVTDCLSTDAVFHSDFATGAADYNATFATVVSAVYANSTLKDCAGTAVNVYTSTNYVNNKAYAVVGDSVYPNDRGEPAIRLYKKGSNAVYLAVDGKINNGALDIKIYNEELTLLTTAHYTRSEGFADAYNVAEEYVNYYFGANGFLSDDNGAVTVEGRNTSEYEFRSGRSTVENVVVGTEIIK